MYSSPPPMTISSSLKWGLNDPKPKRRMVSQPSVTYNVKYEYKVDKLRSYLIYVFVIAIIYLSILAIHDLLKP